jgi:hypothetical protein
MGARVLWGVYLTDGLIARMGGTGRGLYLTSTVIDRLDYFGTAEASMDYGTAVSMARRLSVSYGEVAVIRWSSCGSGATVAICYRNGQEVR